MEFDGLEASVLMTFGSAFGTNMTESDMDLGWTLIYGVFGIRFGYTLAKWRFESLSF
jgi:hypothetical protein